MNVHEFHIQPTSQAGGNRPIGLVRIEIDSDAKTLLSDAIEQVYAGGLENLSEHGVSYAILKLAFRDLAVQIVHAREVRQ